MQSGRGVPPLAKRRDAASTLRSGVT